jgi:nocturnin
MIKVFDFFLINASIIYFSFEILEAGQHGTEPEYTTWKVRSDGEAKSTLDYVFYSKRTLNVDAVLDFPSGESMGEGRLPSLKYPSDHLSLVCDFSFRDGDVRDEGLDDVCSFAERTR